MLLFSSRY